MMRKYECAGQPVADYSAGWNDGYRQGQKELLQMLQGYVDAQGQKQAILVSPAEPEILPCPICGNIPDVIAYPKPSNPKFFGVVCRGCNLGSGRCDTEQEAISRWNKWAKIIKGGE